MLLLQRKENFWVDLVPYFYNMKYWWYKILKCGLFLEYLQQFGLKVKSSTYVCSNCDGSLFKETGRILLLVFMLEYAVL